MYPFLRIHRKIVFDLSSSTTRRVSFIGIYQTRVLLLTLAVHIIHNFLFWRSEVVLIVGEAPIFMVYTLLRHHAWSLTSVYLSNPGRRSFFANPRLSFPSLNIARLRRHRFYPRIICYCTRASLSTPRVLMIFRLTAAFHQSPGFGPSFPLLLVFCQIQANQFPLRFFYVLSIFILYCLFSFYY